MNTIATVIMTVLVSLIILLPPLYIMWRVLDGIGRTPPPSLHSEPLLAIMDWGDINDEQASKATPNNVIPIAAWRGKTVTDASQRTFSQSMNQ